MPDPDLPTITLQHGPWQVAVFDPREDPTALGGRYCHGGYIASVVHDGTPFSARPNRDWDPYVGQGLPEVFEMPLGWGAANPGEPFLRIGVGQFEKRNRDWGSSGQLQRGLQWALRDRRTDHLLFRAEDELRLDDQRYAYRLDRFVGIDDEGLCSRSSLTIDCPWSEAVIWFAHPFFACTSGEEIGLRLPPGAEPPDGFAADDAGWHRLGPDGGFGVITGVTGASVDLPLTAPAKNIHIAGDFPLDKLVVYGTCRAFSIEPYLSRAWARQESQSWQLRYSVPSSGQGAAA